jgi:hypothetical protein
MPLLQVSGVCGTIPAPVDLASTTENLKKRGTKDPMVNFKGDLYGRARSQVQMEATRTDGCFWVLRRIQRGLEAEKRVIELDSAVVFNVMLTG